MELRHLVTGEFQKGLKEGEKGRATIQRTWHFKIEPFSGNESLHDVFVDRVDAVSRVARALGRSVMGLQEITACVGPYGAGVSATLRIVHEALEDSGRIKGVMERASTFTETRERESAGETYEVTYFDVFLEETDFTNVRYVILDEADEVAEYLYDFVRQIKDAAGSFKAQPAVVLGLHIGGWLSLTSELRERIAEQVWLPPLATKEVEELIRGYLAWAKEKDSLDPFDDKTIRRIAEVSGGLPRVAVELARRVVRECATRDLPRATAPLVDEVARAYGYYVVRAVDEWELAGDPTRGLIVEHLVRRPSGVTSSALADVTTVRRTTANYHLTVLEGAGLLVRQRRGREVYYVPTESGRSALEVFMFRKLYEAEGAWTAKAT